MKFKSLLILSGIFCSILWGIITWLSFGLPEQICLFIDQITFRFFTLQIMEMTNGFHYDVNNNDMPTGIVLSLFAFIFILFFCLITQVEKKDEEKGVLKWIIGFAILFRIILLPGVLIHENDMYRYIWDGRVANAGINPFKYAPSDLFMYEYNMQDDYYDDYNEVTLKAKSLTSSDHKRLNTLIQLRDKNSIFFDRIGHWQVPTIYPPITQAVFVLATRIEPHSLLLMKTLFALFDIGIIFIIIAMLKYFHKKTSLCLIYAWSPLVLFEFSNRGHYDAIPIFWTMLSLYFFLCLKPTYSKKTFGTSILALATLAKFFSGVLLPILIRPFKLKYFFIFSITFASFYIPYFIWSQAGISGVFEGFITYNKEWAYNASVFSIVQVILKKVFFIYSFMTAKMVVGGLYLTLLSFLIFKKSKDNFHVLHKCFLAIGGLFIINPVGDPWYFCWTIPFLCFFPYRSWILLSGLLILSYLNFHSDLAIVDMKWGGMPTIGWIIYVPFFSYLVYEQLLKKIKKLMF